MHNPQFSQMNSYNTFYYKYCSNIPSSLRRKKDEDSERWFPFGLILISLSALWYKDLENWLQCDLWCKTVFITVKYVALISSFSCSLNVRRNIRIQSHIHILCIFKNPVMEAGKKDQDGTGDFSCNQEIDAL